jgi:hypothetical protein
MDEQNTWEHHQGKLDLFLPRDLKLLDEDDRDDKHQKITG